MYLYHGSSVAVRNPQIRPGLRALDFGAGFYLTSSKKQAVKWAKVVVKRRKKGKPTEEKFDLVIGHVANDSTLPVIDDYIDGVYTKEEAVRRLLPQNLTD